MNLIANLAPRIHGRMHVYVRVPVVEEGPEGIERDRGIAGVRERSPSDDPGESPSLGRSYWQEQVKDDVGVRPCRRRTMNVRRDDVGLTVQRHDPVNLAAEIGECDDSRSRGRFRRYLVRR